MGLVMGRKRIHDSTGDDSILVNAAGNVYTHSIDVRRMLNIGGKIKASSVAGGVNVIVKLEQSDRLPATEGSADDHWVTPEGVSDIITLTTEVWREFNITGLVTMPYIRFLLDGQAGNSADTLVEGTVAIQEETNR